MSAADLRAITYAFLELGFLAGVAGALFWQLLSSAFGKLSDAWLGWEEREFRIRHARMRTVHGPMLYPGMSAWVRRGMVAAARARHSRESQLQHGGVMLEALAVGFVVTVLLAVAIYLDQAYR